MTAGTKISLALAALLIVGLVVYYGSMTPEDVEADVILDEPPIETEPRAADRTQSPPLAATRQAQRESTSRMETPAEQPRGERTPADSTLDPGPERPPIDSGSGRFLADSVDRALTPPTVETEPVRPLLDDREPVRVPEGRESDGGKDAPELPPVEPDPDVDDVDDREAEEAHDPEDAEEPTDEPRPLPEPPTYTEYTVRGGDTMSSIAAEWFGDESKWDLIAKANPLVDPNRLRIGQVLRLPPQDTERDAIGETAGDAETTYIVRSGDNLSRIARSYYGDASRWRIIFEANRELLRDNPDNLRPGMRLVIPPAPNPADG